jgi:hypothetical protein
MEQSPSREATSCEATQERPNIAWNPKVHYCIYKSPALVPVLTKANPVHTTPCNLSKIDLNIIYSTASW